MQLTLITSVRKVSHAQFSFLQTSRGLHNVTATVFLLTNEEPCLHCWTCEGHTCSVQRREVTYCWLPHQKITSVTMGQCSKGQNWHFWGKQYRHQQKIAKLEFYAGSILYYTSAVPSHFQFKANNAWCCLHDWLDYHVNVIFKTLCLPRVRGCFKYVSAHALFSLGGQPPFLKHLSLSVLEGGMSISARDAGRFFSSLFVFNKRLLCFLITNSFKLDYLPSE